MAVRTVSVALEVKAAKARADLRDTAHDVGKLERSVVDAGKRLDDMAADASQAGRAAEKLAAGAKVAGAGVGHLDHELEQLDRQIATTKAELALLNREFARTGDKTLFKQIRADKSALSMMQRIRKDLAGAVEAVVPEAGKAGGKAGTGFVGGFADALQALPAQARGALMIGIGAAIAAVAPLVGSAIGGAVLGGVGLGGIVGGVIAAAQDQRVADAGAALGERLMGGLKSAGLIFINPLLDIFPILESAGGHFIATLSDGMKKLAPVLRPLALGIEGMARALGPGLSKAFTAAQPAIRAIAAELPRLGDAISRFLSNLADHSDELIEGLTTLFRLIDNGVIFVGTLVGWLSTAWDWLLKVNLGVNSVLERFTKGIGPLSRFFGNLSQGAADALTAVDAAKNAGDDWAGSLARQERSAKEAAAAVEAYENAIKELFGIIMSQKEAEIAYQETLRDTREELVHGARTLAINTVEGDKNARALLAMVQAAEDLRQANIDNGMPLEQANERYKDQVNSLIAMAIKAGFSKTEVLKLIGALRDVPATVKSELTVVGLNPTLNHLKQVDAYMDDLDGRVVTSKVKTEFYEYRAGERNPGRAAGGPVSAGQSYWVGERGPERFTPAMNGMITPTANLRPAPGGGGVQRVEVVVSVAGGQQFSNNVMDAIASSLQYKIRTGDLVLAGG